MSVKFEDNRIEVEAALNDAAIAFLHEAAATLTNQVAENTPVGSGQLKGAWSYVVDESKGEATVGNPLELSIWNEFGTGEYALHGNGRKGGWTYKDDRTGKFRFTYGNTPKRSLFNAFKTLKPAIIREAEHRLKDGMK